MELTAKTFYDETIESCKQGDVAGFKKIYQQYSKSMFNTSLRIVNNVNDAEDIVQESFVDAFRKIDSFNYQFTFGAWIKRIVINKSLNYLRDKKLKFIDIDKANVQGLKEDEEIREDEIEFNVSEIKKAVANLPDGYRTVFTLNVFEGYSYEQIATLLKIAPSTVRTQFHRAKKQLLRSIKGGSHEQ